MIWFYVAIAVFLLVITFIIFLDSVRWEIKRYNYWLERQAEIMLELCLLESDNEGEEWQADNFDFIVDDIRVKLLQKSYQNARKAIYDFERKLSVRLYLKYLNIKK